MGLPPNLKIKSLAAELGFDRVAVASVEPLEQDRDFLRRWLGEGKAAGMGWMGRARPGGAAPGRFLGGGLGVFPLGGGSGGGARRPAPAARAGRVARYAWGEDYHDVIGRRTDRFRRALEGLLGPGTKTLAALDAQPLLERALARRAGVGFVGKNTNLIVPGAGSWFFLTEVVVNRALPSDAPMAQGCGGCVQCQTGCPTGALETAFSLDSRLCVSYHTIENRGAIPREFRPRLKDWIFGCDDCQEVCPFNARPPVSRWPELGADRGAGAWVSLEEVLGLRTSAEFKARFTGTPLLRAKRAGLVRNACVVARNTGAAESLREPLEICLREDPEPIVRGHAAWALGAVASARGVLEAALKSETDVVVKEEIIQSLL
jgi:epoxyqueuosine reductase